MEYNVDLEVAVRNYILRNKVNKILFILLEYLTTKL